jgi:Fe-Mn family superoxide dismutase
MRQILLLAAAFVGLSISTIAHSATLAELGKLRRPFELAPLPYPTGSLAPSIDQKTMEIHHGKHHKAYIDNLNKFIADQKDNKDLQAILGNLKGGDTGVRNNAGGHWNHTFFWSILSGDKAKNKMPETLTKEIEKAFGSIDKFKEQFEKAGAGQFGSGWVWLIRDSAGKLVITATPNQDNPLMDVVAIRGQPIFGVDIWEHAYYLNYQNLRADYLKAVWNIVNWVQVDAYDKEVQARK